METKQMSKVSDRAVINLYELIWELAYQWKLILIFSLIFAILFSGAMYVRSDISYKESQKAKEAPTQTVESVSENLTKDEIASVYNIVSIKQSLIEDTKYRDNSILMSIDPYNVNTLNLYFYLNTNDSKSQVIGSEIYKSVLSSDKITDGISSVFSDKYPKEYIYELISSIEDSTNVLAGILDENIKDSLIEFTMVLPDDKYYSEITDSIEKVLAASYADVESSIGTHSLELIYQDRKVIPNTSIADRQRSINETCSRLTSTVTNAYNAFSDDQKALYDILLPENQDVEKSDAGEEELLVEPASFSVKYFLLGIVLGVFVYCCFVFFKKSIFPNISEPDELERILGLRNFGEIRKYSGVGLLGMLSSSKVLYNIRNKNRINIQKQQNEISDRITKYTGKHDIEKVCFVSLNTLNPGEKDLISAITSAYSLIEGNKEKAADISNEKDIMIILQHGKTSYSSIDRLLSDCVDYNVNIMGTILVDG